MQLRPIELSIQRVIKEVIMATVFLHSTAKYSQYFRLFSCISCRLHIYWPLMFLSRCFFPDVLYYSKHCILMQFQTPSPFPSYLDE